MKVNNRKKINLAAYLLLVVGGPLYCFAKAKLLNDARWGVEIGSWRFVDTLIALSFAAIIIFIPDFLANWLRKKLPQRRLNFLRYSILLVFIIVFIFMIFYSFYWMGNQIGDMEFPLGLFIDFYLITTIIAVFAASLVESNYLSEQWEKETLKREMLEKEHLQAQFEVLKSQVNPHFLFNCFNTLAELINSDRQLATKFVQELSRVYRFVLDNRSNEIVELNNELKLFKSYLFLMQIRFGDNLRIHWNIPEDKTQFGIIPLTSQMLLENAVKHNIISRDKPLNIYIELDENDTLIFRNDLQKKIDSTSSSTKTGLQNIMNRYKYVADEAIEIRETANEFIVKVPLIRIEKL